MATNVFRLLKISSGPTIFRETAPDTYLGAKHYPRLAFRHNNTHGVKMLNHVVVVRATLGEGQATSSSPVTLHPPLSLSL